MSYLVVFEGTLRKIAQKNNLEESGISIEYIIDVFNLLKAKKAIGYYSAVTNKALHAQ